MDAGAEDELSASNQTEVIEDLLDDVVSLTVALENDFDATNARREIAGPSCPGVFGEGTIPPLVTVDGDDLSECDGSRDEVLFDEDLVLVDSDGEDPMPASAAGQEADAFELSESDSDGYDEAEGDDDDDEIDDDGIKDGVDADEIDAMLDERYEEYSKRRAKRPRLDQDGEMAHEEREKVVLKIRGPDHFELLPEGWVEVTHNSGMPLYLHKYTRVCTLSKPYFLGPGSARKHEIPVTAVPCLHYRREIEKESARKSNASTADAAAVIVEESAAADDDDAVERPPENNVPLIDNGIGSEPIALPVAKIESVVDNAKEKSLGHLELRTYCQSLFEFQTITVRRFRTWAGRRKHQKRMKELRRPTLPLGTKLITCPLPALTDNDESTPGTSSARRGEFVMNPNGKSFVCILHEYVQHAMRVQPHYVFRELESSSTPYGSTVLINKMEYGTGFGSSKKHAKSEAARATLEILIPQMKTLNPVDKWVIEQTQDLAFFDEIRLEDPRVSELCLKAGQPSPYQILLECLRRNYGMADTQIKFETRSLKHQKSEFKMIVGKHVATVVCKNKRDGKQLASQAVLQALHRHITSWGSLLRLYGKGTCKTTKEKKEEEQKITELQCRTTANKPNQAILNKLRKEMIKLTEKRDALVNPFGRFDPSELKLTENMFPS